MSSETYFAVGTNHFRSKQFKLACDFFKQGLKVLKGNHNTKLAFQIRYGLVLASKDCNPKEHRSELFQLCQDIPLNEPDYANARLMLYAMKASVHCSMDEWLECAESSRWALRETSASQFATVKPFLLWHLGQAMAQTNSLAKAIEYLEGMASDLSDDKDSVARIKEILVRLCLEHRDFKRYEQLQGEIFEEVVARLPIGLESDSEMKSIREFLRCYEFNESGKLSEFLYKTSYMVALNFDDHTECIELLLRTDKRFRTSLEECKHLVIQTYWRNRESSGNFSESSFRTVDWLDLYLLFQSQACWLSAVSAALSGQVVPTNILLRGVLENAMYAVAVSFKPELRDVWLSRDAGRFRLGEHAFNTAQIWKYFDEFCPHLLARTKRLYDATIENGAHPNPFAHVKTSFLKIEDMSETVGIAMMQDDSVDDLCQTLGETGELVISIANLLVAVSDLRTASSRQNDKHWLRMVL